MEHGTDWDGILWGPPEGLSLVEWLKLQECKTPEPVQPKEDRVTLSDLRLILGVLTLVLGLDGARVDAAMPEIRRRLGL